MSFGMNYEEDLLSRIRDLVDGYSKDSILKEYLQNADDAGATELIVTFDSRKHSFLVGTKFEAAKETSLLLFNNASFKEKDFKAIAKISAQGKIDDATSTGRFGQGFSSSFSISDHPSFISNGKAYWFDVLRKAVSKGEKDIIQGWFIEEDIVEISEWIKTFNIENNQHGTTFRLPLRNTNTASQSNISHEIFKYEDFLKWCDEWKNNTSGLLFLRNVKRLVLQEINDVGEKIIHLELSTKNSSEINEYNRNIQEGFPTGLLNICETWKKQNETLPLFTYHHNFSIKYFDRDSNSYLNSEENWAVVNGLFRGENDILIDQAIKVLSISPNPRKVLPWVGVAISLDKNERVNTDFKSNFYTFLQLPIKSKYPVHVQGWFDLNPKRTEITNDGSGEDKSILIEWNNLLFKEGVGRAWAYLLDFIKVSCDSQKYYSLWPKNNADAFDEPLLEGFYKEITKLQCFKTIHKEKISWKTPKDNIYYLQDNSKSKIFDAFKEHFSIISPKPTQKIIESLNEIGTELEEITPDFIRNYLIEQSEELSFPISLDLMPIKMLSKKEWFLSILIFCAEADEDKNYCLLERLPLELAWNNKVTCLLEEKLLDSNPNFKIFNNDESLFLHPEILEILKDAEILPSTWLVSNLNNYLTVLDRFISEYDKNNKNWLENVVSMITQANESEIVEAIEMLHELEIVFQHNETFAPLKSDKDSPVLILKTEVQNIGYLENTNMHLVHPEYIHIYEPLLKWSKHELITQLNSHTLINYLLYLPVKEYAFFEDKETRDYLIALLAEDISWIGNLTKNELNWLNEMPFIATESSNNIFAKSSDIKLYLPSGFSPPKHIQNLNGEYEIISVADNKQHAMFKKIGFDEQSPINYLEQIILPFIKSLPSVEDVKNITEWLAINWEELTQDIDELLKNKLIDTLSESQIVLDSDCNLNTAKSYYHPNFYNDLPLPIKDEKYLPLTFEDDSTQKKWLDLLTELGASKKILPNHIITTVVSIIEDDDDEKSIALLQYISNHFEWFKDMKYDGQDIFLYLSAFAWMPAEKPLSDFLSPTVEYKKHFKPAELILKNDFKIAGGAHYRFSIKVNLGKKDELGEFTERDIAKSIGLLVDLPPKSIFESFRRLQSQATPKHESKILDFAKAVYKYLGRSNISEDEIPPDIKNKSVLIMGNWLPSNKVFQTPLPLTGIYSWNDLITNDGQDSELARGLIKLGVLESPNNEYLVSYLFNLPQNKKLNSQQLRDAKAILNHLEKNLETIDMFLDIPPLLTSSDQLKNFKLLYIKDLPAYDKSETKNDELEFCQKQYGGLAKKYNVISLAEEIRPQVDFDNSEESEKSNNRWNSYIRSEAFKSAVLRLIYHEGKISDDDIEQESLEHVLPSNVKLMDSLVIKYFIEDTWIYDDKETPTHKDIDQSVLYILNQEDDYDINDSIAAFICDSSELGRESYSLILKILLNKSDNPEELHNLLDKKNIKALPDKIELNDIPSLINITKPSEYVEEINSNVDSVKQKKSQTNTEIPPPITPKQSSPSNQASSDINWDRNPTKINKGSRTYRAADNTYSGTKRKTHNINSKGKTISSNDWKPVYVGIDKELDADKRRNHQANGSIIGDEGEQYILDRYKQFVLHDSNIFDKAPKNNEGYDIREIDSTGKIVRYIEVKTLTGRWGEKGVAVTPSQLIFALANDNWWLFVVENLNTQYTDVHLLNNPVKSANKFMFDHSWKQLATNTKLKQIEAPKVGEKYLISDVKYEILFVKTKGIFFQVKIKNIQTSEEKNKKFDRTWVRC